MDAPFSLQPAASAVAALLPGVSDDQLSDRTPCTELTVRALLNHLMGLSLAFRYMAAPEEAAAAGFEASGPSFTEDLDPQWRTLLPRRLTDLVETWAQPGSWDGESTVAGNVMPNDQVAMVTLDELVLHGWDLATATGQPFELPAGTDPGLYGFVSALASDSGIPGLFGPQVPISPGAPRFDHMLAMSGRDPGWRPENM
ncbi:TIGR03086 family protein [Mycobacterium sp. CBMA271]|uniref:TIGR03086 family metal-binding protein n=1 Tax=unclassified Mycobacteroides TaxID=2618759 RepID=UPI0012DF1080|nr:MULTISPECIES: TIGR03086 family metal-binding protein [unclassified Mycobacteroides]MUM17661.1 TIGR03086 family protein [Mycobacteroides sp. CBMA 326]MUM23064.1 TIGR03086 family protein [Mycobacteroides sp. CBMA 271]